MKGSHLKTTAVILLLIINVFLLGSLWLSGAFASGMNSKQRDGIAALLEANGMTGSERIYDLRAPAFSVYSLERDTIAEQECLTPFGSLQKVEMQGGGIVSYKCDDADAVFRTLCQFEITAGDTGVRLDSRSSARNSVRALFKILKFDKNSYDITYSSEKTDSAIASQTLDGFDIFNSLVEITALTDGKISVSGRWMIKEPVREGRTAVLSAHSLLAEAILHFARSQSGVTNIASARFGYLIVPDGVSGMAVQPFLSVTTDAGVYYVNAVTGEIKY